MWSNRQQQKLRWHVDHLSSQLGLCTSIRAWMNTTIASFSPFWISLQAGKKYKVDLSFISKALWRLIEYECPFSNGWSRLKRDIHFQLVFNCQFFLIHSKSLLSFHRFFYMNLVVNTGFNTTLSHQSEICCTLIPIQTRAFMESREHWNTKLKTV